ncbi:MAG: hypothetical protein HZA28_06505 [Candidatus Omnitrophica bacterium]|nr:hypothetical protein [Candidatus Omnitrophota bacterium]
MSEKLVRVYKKFYIDEIKAHLLVYEDLGGSCAACQKIDVFENLRKDAGLKDMVKGLMIESYLVEGTQDAKGGVYGRSITDACLGWEDSEKLILDIAEGVTA